MSKQPDISLLAQAAMHNQVEEMRRMLSNKSCFTSSIQEAMILAASGGHIEALSILLEHGADLDQEPVDTDYCGYSPLLSAVNFEQEAATEYLIRRGANPNYAPRSSGNYPLILAVACEGDAASQCGTIPKMRCSQVLFQARANPFLPNSRGENAMEQAIFYNHAEAIAEFTQFGKS